MSHIPVLAGAAFAGHAAAKARKLREEEEQLTNYHNEDLNNWEFKIVRSVTGKFGNREIVQKMISEEAQSGWEMLEKFDNYRIRFKRRVEMRSKDQFAKIDPYRTLIGISEGGLALSIIGSIIVILGIVLLTIYYIKGGF